ncbi:hypothetical protein DERF_004151 [Dermatophagoides farinae]|uniref:Uncharacterized protein n=1 Tax=Dermatophagoides farinae TaxID=6954 RepID=A0A922IH79_DERFA|nr:hypothetical protein DERF_016675 [Dermatophagoides farinae]KAH9530339.1 hypothetical protein DERF_004151 [Dermatophagoides farinae]
MLFEFDIEFERRTGNLNEVELESWSKYDDILEANKNDVTFNKRLHSDDNDNVKEGIARKSICKRWNKFVLYFV